MLQALRTIVYPVGNLAEAKAWYSALLEQPPYFDEPYYVGFNVGGFELGLVPDAPVAGQCGPITYWTVPDADAAYQRLLALGASAHEEIYDVGGGIRLGSVQEPFGNLLGVICMPPVPA